MIRMIQSKLIERLPRRMACSCHHNGSGPSGVTVPAYRLAMPGEDALERLRQICLFVPVRRPSRLDRRVSRRRPGWEELAELTEESYE
jgi:hypothetical protein